MPKKPELKRVTRLTLSRELVDRLVRLIRAGADRLADNADENYKYRGIQNAGIVNAVQAEAEALCQPEYAATIATLLSTMVPLVLGGKAQDDIAVVAQEIIPGLDIPEWLAVPREEDDQGRDGWKRALDVTPNELTRIIATREKDIEGRMVEKNKLVLTRDTALEVGCDPNEPISTVFGDEDEDTIFGDLDLREPPS